eukprot:6194002-Pleurochrysis_carterae.AAC.1
MQPIRQRLIPDETQPGSQRETQPAAELSPVGHGHVESADADLDSSFQVEVTADQCEAPAEFGSEWLAAHTMAALCVAVLLLGLARAAEAAEENTSEAAEGAKAACGTVEGRVAAAQCAVPYVSPDPIVDLRVRQRPRSIHVCYAWQAESLR